MLNISKIDKKIIKFLLTHTIIKYIKKQVRFCSDKILFYKLSILKYILKSDYFQELNIYSNEIKTEYY